MTLIDGNQFPKTLNANDITTNTFSCERSELHLFNNMSQEHFYYPTFWHCYKKCFFERLIVLFFHVVKNKRVALSFWANILQSKTSPQLQFIKGKLDKGLLNDWYLYETFNRIRAELCRNVVVVGAAAAAVVIAAEWAQGKEGGQTWPRLMMDTDPNVSYTSTE